MSEDLERFYNAIWAPAGHRVLARACPGGGMEHFWGASTDELLFSQRGRLRQHGMFHSVATFRRVDARDNIKKEGVKIGELRRFKQLVLWSKCGHNEIDIREGKDSYVDVDEVIRAIEPIEGELRQRALIVWSGSGVHLYWIYERPVDSNTWWSDTLVRESLMRRFNIKGHDSPVAKDRTRLLRVPGSINEKYGTPVRLIRWHDCERTPRYIPQISLDTKEQEDAYQDRRYKHLTPELVLECCPQLRQFKEYPEKQTYNEWIGCASLLRRIPGGREKFLEWSANDKERFDYDTAESHLDSLTGKDAQACEKFLEEISVSPCQSCIHAQKKSNPLKIALTVHSSSIPVIEPSDTPLPPGYTFNGTKIVIGEGNLQAKGQGGLPVSSKPFYVDGLYVDEASKAQTLLVRYLDPTGKNWLQATAPMGKALSNPTQVFGDKLALTERSRLYLFDSVTLYEERIMSEGRDSILPVVKYMGWHKSTKGGYCFNYGDKLISDRGVYRVITDPNNAKLRELTDLMEVDYHDPEELERAYQDWQILACEYANDKSVPLACRIFLLLGFVSPVVRLIAEGQQFGGLVANIWGKTNWGKTLAMIAATSIYGKSKMILPVNVSEAALYHAVSCTPNLPICVDEFTSSQIVKSGAKGIHDFIKSFADGQAPARMNSDGTARASKNWNTLALTSANERFVDLMRAYGGQDDVRAAEMRVVELPLPQGEADESLRSQDYTAFTRLTGLAGPRWIRHLCKPGVQLSLNRWMSGYECQQLPSEARLLRKLAGLMEWTMKELWNETRPCWLEDGCLGMVKFPFHDIMDFYFESQIGHAKESKAAHTLPPVVQSILDFLDLNKDKCAIYNSYPNGKVDAPRRAKLLRPTNDDMPIIRNGGATNSFVVDIKMHYIPHNALMNYHNKRMGTRGFTNEIEKLVNEGVTKKVLHRVNGNVNYEKGEEPCWRFPRDVIEHWLKG